MQIRQLTVDDAAAWYALRLEMLADGPGVFSASLDEARAQGVAYAQARFKPRNQIFGAFVDDALIGAVGLARRHNPKIKHKAFIWGMYVQPAARRWGAGRALIQMAMKYAKHTPGVLVLELSVTSDAPHARALYEELGFVRWGHEPAAMLVDERFVDEHHYSMWLMP
ncbi:MAG: RimJ/RimL family protein N-acetyltransferase [Bradymonadia bacterium]|jgi:RimJ/RimL family protein N-acetyltransferase